MQTKYGPYSPSRLNVATCPYRFKAEYIDKSIVDEGSLQARRGNVIHETFEALVKSWLRNQGLTWDQVVEVLKDRMVKYAVTNNEDQNTCIGAARCFMLNPPHHLETCCGTEEQISVKWDEGSKKYVTCPWEDPESYARGKIDLLMIDDSDVATIIDHKTQLHVEEANTFQVGFYAWLVKIAYPYLKQVKTILHFCHPDLAFYSKPYSWTPEDLEIIETRIKINIGIAENLNVYPAVASQHCQYCPIKMECPKLLDLRKRRGVVKKAVRGPLISAKEAQNHAEILTVLGENKDEIQLNLKAFVQEVGPVQITGLEYSMVPSDEHEVPLENRKKLIELLGSYGLNPYAYLSFSATSLKSVWKVLDQQKIEEIKKLIVSGKKTTFRGRKV